MSEKPCPCGGAFLLASVVGIDCDLMMKTRELIWEYITRLFRKTWFSASGGVGFLISLVLTVLFPNLVIPAVYGLIFLVGFVVANYQVFSDLFREYEKAKTEHRCEGQRLKQEVRDLEAARPRINVGFQDSNQHLTKRVLLRLAPLPPEPNFDALVAERLRSFSDQDNARQEPLKIGRLFDALSPSLFGERNPNYERDLERYAEEYRAFRVRCYEHSLVPDRTRSLTPIVENLGHHPANNVTVELQIPATCRIRGRHRSLIEYRAAMELTRELGYEEDELWRLQTELLCEPPQEPRTYTEPLSALIPSEAISPPHYRADVPEYQSPPNTSGPSFEERDGTLYVEYHIDQLVQHRPEDDFEPFEVWLGDVEESAVWDITVTVTSADLHQPVEDVLRMEVVVAEAE